MDLYFEKSHLPYSIFVYREELRRRRRNITIHNKVKIDITQELVVNCAKKLWQCDQEDIEAFSRQLMFRDKLLEQQNYLCGSMNVTSTMEVEENMDLDIDMNSDFVNSVDFEYFEYFDITKDFQIANYY